MVSSPMATWISDRMVWLFPVTFLVGVLLIVLTHHLLETSRAKARRRDHAAWWHRARFTPWPTGLQAEWLARYPGRTELAFAQAGLALRQYFYLTRLTGSATALPSAAADSIWHLLLERPGSYANFCHAAVGRVIPHIEAAHFDTPLLPALALTWALACTHEEIDPVHPHRLPFLFAVDAELKWTDGYAYRTAGTGVELLHADGQWHPMGWKAWIGGGLAWATAGYAWANPPTAKAVETHGGSSCGSYPSCDTGHGSGCGSHGSACGSSCGSSCGGGCGGGD